MILVSLIVGGILGKLGLSPYLASRASGSPHPLYDTESRLARSSLGVVAGAVSGGLVGWLLSVVFACA